MSWFLSPSDSKFFENIGAGLTALGTGILSGFRLGEKSQNKASNQPNQLNPESSGRSNGSHEDQLVEDKESQRAKRHEQKLRSLAPTSMEVPDSFSGDLRNNLPTESPTSKTSSGGSQSNRIDSKRGDPVMSLVDDELARAGDNLRHGHPRTVANPKTSKGRQPNSPSTSYPEKLEMEDALKDSLDAEDPRAQAMKAALAASQRGREEMKQASDLARSMGASLPPIPVPGERIGDCKKITARVTEFNRTIFEPILTYQVKITENLYLKLYVDDSANFAMKIGSIDQNGKFNGRPVGNQEDIILNDDARLGLRRALLNLETEFNKMKPGMEDTTPFDVQGINEFTKYIYDQNIKDLTGLSFRNINNLTARQNGMDAVRRDASRYKHPVSSAPSSAPRPTEAKAANELHVSTAAMFMGSGFRTQESMRMEKSSRYLANMTAADRAKQGDVSTYVPMRSDPTPKDVERARRLMKNRHNYEREMEAKQPVILFAPSRRWQADIDRSQDLQNGFSGNSR